MAGFAEKSHNICKKSRDIVRNEDIFWGEDEVFINLCRLLIYEFIKCLIKSEFRDLIDDLYIDFNWLFNRKYYFIG